MKYAGRILRFNHILVIAAILLSGCFPESRKEAVQANSLLTPTAILPQATMTPEALKVWVSQDLPAGFREKLRLPVDATSVTDPVQANVKITLSDETKLGTWYYVLAAPFPTVTDGISGDDLKNFWLGTESNFSAKKILASQETQALLTILLGKPDKRNIRTLLPGNTAENFWQEDIWVILPFEQIEPKWKVIAIDGLSPIEKSFQPDNYLLKAGIGAETSGSIDASQISNAILNISEKLTNRDPEKLTTLVLTGVTALVRGTAAMMQIKGVKYPGEEIGPMLREADILHVNNEVPFSPSCTQPPVNPDELVFCSKPAYMGLLEDIGTDVVELDGDHFQDWGKEAVLFTLDLYKEKGMQYYGGGENISYAKKPLLVEHNGNKLAFLGCNAKPPGYATASATNPGALHCNFNELIEEIRKVKAGGYLPVVTFQHLEYYSNTANPILKADFQSVADAGAVIVSGSQAHIPQAMEFRKGAFLHYGLGNLFFDQYYESEETRKAFIDRHVFYDGKYINTQLITIMFIDIARPRYMTTGERQDLLEEIFAASGWEN